MGKLYAFIADEETFLIKLTSAGSCTQPLPQPPPPPPRRELPPPPPPPRDPPTKPRRKPICTELGCLKQARAPEYIKYGGGKRCVESGCLTAAQGGDRCKKHRAGLLCSQHGCLRLVKEGAQLLKRRAPQSLMCSTHSGGGKPSVYYRKRCVESGCLTRAAEGGDRCKKHRSGRLCSLHGCLRRRAPQSLMCPGHYHLMAAFAERLLLTPNSHSEESQKASFASDHSEESQKASFAESFASDHSEESQNSDLEFPSDDNTSDEDYVSEEDEDERPRKRYKKRS
jgi:hypothetical protein